MHLARLVVVIAFGFLQLNLNGAVRETHLTYLEPDLATGTSKAVITDSLSLIHTSQILPYDTPGQIISRDVTAQSGRVFVLLSQILSTLNSGYGNIIKLNIYIRYTNDYPLVQKVLAQIFTGTNKPAVTFVVTVLPHLDALVAMDAVAIPRLQTDPMIPRPILPAGLSFDNEINPATGPANGPIIYVSGMADTNSLPVATTQTLGKLMSAIGHSGLGKSDVLQLKAFFQPMSEAGVVRKAIVDYFGGHAPPTVFVEWISPAPNPPIEIELIVAGKTGVTNENDSVVFLTPPGTTSTKVFSRVAKVNRGKLIYVSGLYGMGAQDGVGEVEEIFKSLEAVLKKTGSDFEHLVKATYYVTDDLAGNALNDIRPKFFNPVRPPTASKAKVRGVAVEGKTVTVDMIAVTK